MNDRSIRILIEEHRIILSVLDALQKVCDDAEKSGRLDVDTSDDIVRFVREFADECHHGKEEDVLFLEMRSRRVGEDMVAMLVEDHVNGRELVRTMSESLKRVRSGSAPLSVFVDPAREYIDMLRAHIRKEDDGAFPMAAQGLSSEGDHSLLVKFEEVEKGRGRHAEAIRRARAIGEKTGSAVVERSAIPTIHEVFLGRETL